eukprot:TRINITY_DN53693_c0_g1_i1.p1 TRINITY_DN53693_c0_g1~~TRINITY_DN53693_c0_g1_i1.p1  ORF type:complete len:473 (-),score=73.26 TRINITY_DN53693_c0_g1_i1:20-1438(-)
MVGKSCVRVALCVLVSVVCTQCAWLVSVWQRALDHRDRVHRDSGDSLDNLSTEKSPSGRRPSTLAARPKGKPAGQVFNLEDAPVDLVYCWTGEVKDGCQTRSHDFGCDIFEMRYSLRSVEKYAPWVNKIYLLVNGPSPSLPSFVKEGSQLIEVVDRCTLFDDPRDCPTFNSWACQSVVHRVPKLSKRFVYMEDDYFFVKPLNKSTFFTSEGVPRVFIHPRFIERSNSRSPRRVSTYDGEAPIPIEQIPDRLAGMSWHCPIPLDRDFTYAIELKFPEWFKFVRSHRYRYCCCSLENQSDLHVHRVCLEEMFDRIWPVYMLRAGQGVVDRTQTEDPFCELDHDGPEALDGLDCLEQAIRHDENARFLNLNNVLGYALTLRVVSLMNEKLPEMASFEVGDWTQNWTLRAMRDRFGFPSETEETEESRYMEERIKEHHAKQWLKKWQKEAAEELKKLWIWQRESQYQQRISRALQD